MGGFLVHLYDTFFERIVSLFAYGFAHLVQGS